MSIPALLAELRQAIEHANRARAAIRTALDEMDKAQVIIAKALGASVADKTIHAAAASAKQLLAQADQQAATTTTAANRWMAKVGGQPSPGER